MALTRLYMDELARLQRSLLSLFERALLPVGFAVEEGGLGAWSPPVDLVDTGAAYRLVAELPGVVRENIDLTVEGNTVELAGRVPPPGEEVSFLRVERSYGAFRRLFQLETPVDADGVSAQLENGVLTVTLPKRAGVRKVAVSEPVPEPKASDDDGRGEEGDDT